MLQSFNVFKENVPKRLNVTISENTAYCIPPPKDRNLLQVELQVIFLGVFFSCFSSLGE